VLNQILSGLVAASPWHGLLQDAARPSPLLSLNEYTGLLFANGTQELVLISGIRIRTGVLYGMSGFENLSHLSFAFTQYFGYPPSALHGV
jgi:hypothetical protein